MDYVEAQHLVVRWNESEAFLADEQAVRRIREDNELNRYDEESPVATALYSVFDDIGDTLRFYRGVLSGTPEALERTRRRAKINPAEKTPLLYVDRAGKVHLPFTDALTLAMAFCAAEPETVRTGIDATERKQAREASSTGDDWARLLLNQHRAAWALIRQWAALGPTDALRSEIERLQRLVLDAVYALQRAGLDQVANQLRQAL